MRNLYRKNPLQSGRSMIEMLGVLAIIGVLSIGGIAGYAKAMSKYRVNKTADQISQLAQSIRTLYASQKNYSTLSNDVIKKAHLAPEEMYESTPGNTTMTNPFGGQVGVSSSYKMNSGDNKAFLVYVTGIPQEACIELATQDWGSGASGLIGIGTAYTTPTAYYITYGCTYSSSEQHCAQAGVMSITNAINGCKSATSNTVSWKFY